MKKLVLGRLRGAVACFSFMVIILASIFSVSNVYAHEAYVLTPEQFEAGSEEVTLTVFEALDDPENLWLALGIVFGTLVVISAHFIFRKSRFGQRVEHQFEKLSHFGSLALRVTIAASFFYSALSGSFLGPEVALATLPWAGVI